MIYILYGLLYILIGILMATIASWFTARQGEDITGYVPPIIFFWPVIIPVISAVYTIDFLYEFLERVVHKALDKMAE